jgi:hypothetical protein
VWSVRGVVQLHKQLTKLALLRHAISQSTQYSNSALEGEMMLWCFDDQETRFSPRNTA